MSSPSYVPRAIALALVLAAAAAGVCSQGDPVGSPALLVLVLAGSMSVGGIAPRGWWWLGGLVGAGATAGRLIAAGGAWDTLALAGGGSEVSWAPWIGLAAPVLVALAGAGLGAAWRQHTGFGPDA